MSAKMKSKGVSAEHLIAAVKEHPSIWDSRCQDYRKKTQKRQAWFEVANVTIEGWNEFTPKEQNSALIGLVGRWNNIRDYFNKSLKAERLDSLRGISRSKKVYIYADALKFIRPELERNLRLNLSDTDLKMEHEDEEDVHLSDSEDADFNDITFVDTLDNYEATPSNESQSNEFDGNQTQYTRNVVQEDHDLMFLKSLLPDMKKLKDKEKFEFKYAIMTAYKNIIEKRTPNECQNLE